MIIRNATKDDAATLAILINLAGEGMPEYLWSQMADKNQSAFEVGAERAARTEGGFSYTNARVCTLNDEILGMIIAYRQPDTLAASDFDDCPEFIRPLIVLEAKVPASWYVNALATIKLHRQKGVARILLADAEKQAANNHCNSISLIVSSENQNAIHLYSDIGYRKAGHETIIPCPGLSHNGDWILMTKQILTNTTR